MPRLQLAQMIDNGCVLIFVINFDHNLFEFAVRRF